MKRRTFLQQLAATPLIFGLGSVFSQEDGSTPDWYRKALLKMKQTGRYGIVIVVPEDPKKREQAASALYTALLRKPSSIFCEAVFICLSSKMAKQLVRKPGENSNRFLLDPSGKRIYSDRINVTYTLKSRRFSASFERFLHGRNNVRLKRQVAQIEVPEKIRVALEQLESDRIEERSHAEKILLESMETIAPLLALLRTTTSREETRARIDTLMRNHVTILDAESGFPQHKRRPRKLPYGTVLNKRKIYPESDPCGACGMALPSPTSRSFLTFIAR